MLEMLKNSKMLKRSSERFKGPIYTREQDSDLVQTLVPYQSHQSASYLSPFIFYRIGGRDSWPISVVGKTERGNM